MSLKLTVISSNEIRRPSVEWASVTERPIVGKDVLELLSTSMYVNALSIFREYVQNAADSVDEALTSGILDSKELGAVQINVDQQERVVRIRDNGTGVKQEAFIERLVAFGASKKRGTRARGFRGVGRLAGLGYCQELIFRSRASGQAQVSELRWDCRQLKALLRDKHFSEQLDKLVGDVVTTRRLTGTDFPKHFFEVELRGIVRHGNDLLMDSVVIENYLSQVAPVPFSPEFGYGKEIENLLRPYVNLGNLQIHINDDKRPVYRPHRNRFEVRRNVQDHFRELQFLTIPASDGPIAAVGWVLHHDYLGAFPNSSNVKGLRLRSGNMQVGEANLLDELFAEPRFNSWTVGEVHILDERIFPNGRRDHFEQSVHFHNVLNQLAPLTRDLGRRCRSSSIKRNWMRQFQQSSASVRDHMSVLRQGAVTQSRRAAIKVAIEERIARLQKIASLPMFDVAVQKRYSMQLKRVNVQLSKLADSKKQHRKVARLRGSRRLLVQKLCDLVYENSRDQASARLLIERILRRL